jgi:hypothetical protein
MIVKVEQALQQKEENRLIKVTTKPSKSGNTLGDLKVIKRTTR